jgi:alkanesulfonate monooxygenase SsuD/methylene tetrahydromethanopterin reductase-like flavin-dependent oxidoreductase (luciferase family)
LINKPLRERIPILLAATGPKNVALAAEIADGWMSVFFWPELSDQVWGEALAAGTAKRDAVLGPLDVIVSAPLAIDEAANRGNRADPTDSPAIGAARRQLALYVGGMGARGSNFYYDMACRYGYSAEAALVQQRFLSGDRAGAEAAVPMDLVRATSLIGPPSYVAERVEALRAAGVTTLNVSLVATEERQRLADLSRLRDLLT